MNQDAVDGVISRDMAHSTTSAPGQATQAAPVNNGTVHAESVGNNSREQQTSLEATAADMNNKEAHGATVYHFDPDATPEQKRALALKGAADKLAPLSDKLKARHEGGTEVATDLGGKNVAPTISANDVMAASSEESGKADTQAAGQAAIPGGLPQEVAAAIPEWYKVGWRAQSQHLLDSGGDLQVARQRDLLSEFVSESYYGAWYHNAAIIFFAVFASHFVTVFDMGKGWLIIILAICSTYYQTSVARVRHRARDDITREVSKQRLYTDVESVDWMNNFMSRFWLIYEPVLSAVVVASVDQTLSASAPPGVDSMRMTHFTLGTKAPRVDFIRTHPGTEMDVVVMDWKISFTPNDVADLTTRQAADKVNPKIVLTIRFGKGKITLAKDIVVEDITFTGVMRIRLKLMNNYPHVQTVDLSFLEKPIIDYAAKPIGFDLNNIPGLENFIDSQLHATLGPMMYDPNVFTINLEQLLSSAPIDTAIGVLQITIYNARGLKGVKLGGGNPDPYISFGLGTRAGLAKTKIKHSSVNPHWNESKFLLVNSLNDPLMMAVMDFNDHRKDGELGTAVFDLKSLAEDAEQEELTAPVLLGGKTRGTVKFDLRFFPLMKPQKLADGTEEPLPESKTGIARITLHQGKDLDTRRTGGECNAYARIYLRGQAIHKTPTFKRNHAPMWEAHTEFLVTSKHDAVIGVKVVDNKGFAVDPTIGYVNVKLDDILAANAKQQDWFPLSGCASGKVRMSASFKPVAMAGAINSSGDFRPPIGIVRIWIRRAVDLKNVEALTGGKSDPYIRVLRSGLICARTLVFNNNLDPEFDEIVYAPVHSLSEVLILEAMDYQHNSKDRPLGQTRLEVKSLAAPGPDVKETPYVATGLATRSDSLQTENGRAVKGNLVYEAQFFPTINLRGVAFAPPTSPLDKLVAPRNGEDDDDDNASIIEADDDTATIFGEDELSQQMNTEVQADDQGTIVSNLTRQPTRSDSPATGSHRKNLPSVASFATAGTAATSPSVTEGVTLSKEELLANPSGVLVFNIISGQLARKGARLEVLFDDGYWPSYSTEVARSSHNTWDEVGEAFIRELGYSRIILKLNEADKDSREDVQAILRTSLGEFLEQCLDKPADFLLTNDQGGNRSTVTISAKYVPVPIKLEMRETVNNTGILRVDLLEGSGLKSADRNGKSDPYCHFNLNGQRVFKSAIQKKTLNPKWNEHFETAIPSRVSAHFEVEVLDWDRVGTSDKLGRGRIDLIEMEPFQSTPRTIPLFDSAGKEHGSIDIRMVFRPEFVSRSRAATSTFVGGIAGGAAHGAVGVVGGGAHLVGKGGKLAFGGASMVAGGAGAVGKGVFAGVKHVVPGHHRKDSPLATDEAADGYSVPTDSVVPHPGDGVNGTIAHEAITGSGSPDFGNLQITIGEIRNDSEREKVHVVVKSSGKTLDKSHSIKGSAGHHDVFRIRTLPESLNLTFLLLEKKTLGKDKELGSTDLDVWQYISPHTKNAAETSVAIGSSTISISLAWTGIATEAPVTPARVSSLSQSQVPRASPGSPASIKSRSRFSMYRKTRDD